MRLSPSRNQPERCPCRAGPSPAPARPMRLTTRQHPLQRVARWRLSPPGHDLPPRQAEDQSTPVAPLPERLQKRLRQRSSGASDFSSGSRLISPTKPPARSNPMKRFYTSACRRAGRVPSAAARAMRYRQLPSARPATPLGRGGLLPDSGPRLEPGQGSQQNRPANGHRIERNRCVVMRVRREEVVPPTGGGQPAMNARRARAPIVWPRHSYRARAGSSSA